MYWQKKWNEEDKDQALKDEILAIRREHKDYGYRRIHLELKNRGWAANKKKVQRLVQVMGLQV
ncbi:IS3 family transposase, partial [Aedoeadaptatus acetigenes]